MWWSKAEWAALASSDRCSMCADASLPINEHTSLIAATDISFMRLSHNQAHRGYSLVILRDHVTDMTDLSPEQLADFWRDVQRAGRAITRAFTPMKIDYLVMGHRLPQLHCHLLPQHADDDPLRNPDISDGPVVQTAHVLAEASAKYARAWTDSQ